MQPTEKSAIRVLWEDYPENYTNECKERVKTYFQAKYASGNVTVVFRDRTKGKKEQTELAVNDNILDPAYQQKLFREWIQAQGIEVDFDDILNLDVKVGEEIKDKVDLDYQYNYFRVKRIEFDNFLSFGEGNVLDLERYHGLTVVASDPQNQGGKTTLLRELPMFAFFNKVEKAKTQADLFNIYRKANEVRVTAYFEVNGENYAIERKIRRSLKRDKKSYNVEGEHNYYRVDNEGHLEMNETEEQKAATQTVIRKVVGNIDDFLLTILATDKTLDRLIDTQPTERGEILSRFMGLKVLELKEDACKALYSQWNKGLKSNTYNITALELENDAHAKSVGLKKEENVEIDQHIRSADTKIASLTIEKDNLLSGRHNDIDQNILKNRPEDIDLELSRYAEQIGRKVTEALDLKKKAEEEVPEPDQELFDHTRSEIESMRTRISVMGSEMESIKKTGSSLRSDLARAGELEEERKLLQEKYDSTIKECAEDVAFNENGYKDLIAKERQLSEQVAIGAHQITAMERALDKLKAEGACSLCLRPFNDHNHAQEVERTTAELKGKRTGQEALIHTHQELQQQIKQEEEKKQAFEKRERLLKEAQGIQSHIDILSRSLLSMEEKRSQLNSCLSEYKEKEKERNNLIEQLPALERLLSEQQQIIERNNLKEKAGLYLIKVQAELEALENKVKSREADKESYRLNLAKIEENKAIDTEVIKKNYEIKTQEDSRRSLQSSKDKNLFEIEKLDNQVEENKKIIAIIRREEKVAKVFKTYQEMTGKNGIGKTILKNIIPHINSELDRILSDVVNFGVELEIDEKNEIRFLMFDRTEPIRKDLRSGSGMERTAAAIALRCILSRISCLPKPNFIVFDEVLGKVGEENLPQIGVLFGKISEMFENIFLITHNSLVKDWGENIITVSKTDNISVIN